MNPIDVLCTAVALGCLTAMPWVVYGVRVGREAALAIHPPRHEWEPEPASPEDDVDLLAWIQGLPSVRSEDGSDAIEDCGEVPAR